MAELASGKPSGSCMVGIYRTTTMVRLIMLDADCIVTGQEKVLSVRPFNRGENISMKRIEERAYKSKNASQLSIIGLVLFCLSCSGPVQAQNSQPMQAANPDISMSLYPVEKGADGQQYIITKAGYKITVPGLGIAPNATDIAVYRDGQNHFWYVDKNGATQPVSQSQLQWTMAQINHQQAMRNIEAQRNMPPSSIQPNMMGTPGMMQGSVMQPAMMQPGMMVPGQTMAGQTTPNVIINNQQPATQSSSGASSAMVSGLAAGGGAMLGSMIGSSMYDHNSYGMPYGVPMYNSAGHYYYNGANGEHYEVPYDHANPYMNQWNRQQAYQENSQNRQNAYNNLNENQQQMLKNQSYEDMKQRSAAQSTAEAQGETRRQGDEALHEERFGDRFGGFGERFRR